MLDYSSNKLLQRITKIREFISVKYIKHIQVNRWKVEATSGQISSPSVPLKEIIKEV